MQPERRLILAAVVLAIAQQEAKNVKWTGVSPRRVANLSRLIAEEARIWVASASFADMCSMVDIEADTMRRVNPDVALEWYKEITSDNFQESRLAQDN